MRGVSITCLVLSILGTSLSQAQDGVKPGTSRGDKLIAEYFQHQTEQLERKSLSEIKTLDDWKVKQAEYRRQLFEMLGLDPLPKRTPLQATTTGKVEQEDFTVENVHFQSLPHLYVTGNLYLPKGLAKPAPAILYLCGHGGVKKDGVSYGNKVHYQHHGAWYARHGYVCLVIDSLQLGEIEALHHGLYKENMWWWPSRGYTPAGVEAWNCIRALDYLQSRPEVDGEKLGATGRSGGGAYSWWIAALDERIKVAVPVAGITDLRNHIVDGCVAGHCDCMYMNNTFQWDYPQVAALVAPRPLVISNTDRDPIFPLDGVYRTFVSARRIYELHQVPDKIAFNITSGPHKDTQELQMQAFRWFDHYLLGVDRLITKPAVPFFKMEQLKVFEKLPEDQVNTKIQELFVAEAPPPPVPVDKAAWTKQRDEVMVKLKERVFRAWPTEVEEFPFGAMSGKEIEHDGLTLELGSFDMPIYTLKRTGLKVPKITILNVVGQEGWEQFQASLPADFGSAFPAPIVVTNEKEYESLKKTLMANDWAFVYFAPRGYGPTQWTNDERARTQIRRRFILLGETHDGAAALDVRRAIRTLRRNNADIGQLWLASQGQMAGVTLAASLFEPSIAQLDLYDLPKSLRDGPYFINAQHVTSTPELVALAAERSRVVLYSDAKDDWQYPKQVVEKLGWDNMNLQLRNASIE